METTNTDSTKEMNKDAVDRKKAKRNRTPFSEMRISFMKNMGKDVSDEYENESGKYVKTDKKPDEPKQELRMKKTLTEMPTQELRMKKTLTGIEKE